MPLFAQYDELTSLLQRKDLGESFFSWNSGKQTCLTYRTSNKKFKCSLGFLSCILISSTYKFVQRWLLRRRCLCNTLLTEKPQVQLLSWSLCVPPCCTSYLLLPAPEVSRWKGWMKYPLQYFRSVNNYHQNVSASWNKINSETVERRGKFQLIQLFYWLFKKYAVGISMIQMTNFSR